MLTFVALLSVNSYWIYDNIVDKYFQLNTLLIVAVLLLSAVTFMAPVQRIGRSTSSNMATTPIILMVFLYGFITYEYQYKEDFPKL